MVLRDIYNGMEEPLHDMGWLRPYGSDDFELLFFSDQGWKAPLTSPVKDAYVKDGKLYIVKAGDELLCISLDSSGALPYPVDVQLGEGGTNGSYATGDEIPAGTSLYDVISNMLRRREPLVVEKPSLGNLEPLVLEAGSITQPFLFPYVQNDGGELLGWTMNLNGNGVISGGYGEPVQWDPQGLQLVDGKNVMYITIEYAQGPVPKDNLGDEYPDRRIPAGSVTLQKVMTGYRNIFLKVSGSAIEDDPRTWDSIPCNGLERFEVGIPEGSMEVRIAVPQSFGGVDIRSRNNGFLVQRGFDILQEDIQGANGYQEAAYDVYVFSSLVPMQEERLLVTKKTKTE